MSNLKLPNMSYADLSRRFSINDVIDRKHHKLAYETTIRATEPTGSTKMCNVYVFHHGNAIAELTEHKLTFSNAGWNSSTTTNRLHRILKDNKVDNYSFNMRGGEIVLMGWGDKNPNPAIRDKNKNPGLVQFLSQGNVTFTRTGWNSAWELVSY